MDKKIIIFGMMCLLIGSASATRVGLIVEFPNGTNYVKCLNVAADVNGKVVLESGGFTVTGSTHPDWGFFLECIDGVCSDTTNYWAYGIAKAGETSWTHAPVGIGPGGSFNSYCWNRDYSSYEGHYCAVEDDVLGFAYGGWGVEPSFLDINQICPRVSARKKTHRELKINIMPELVFAGEAASVFVLDGNTLEPVSEAVVGVYTGTPGVSTKLFEGETDASGKVTLSINDVGNYKARVIAYRYPHEYFDLSVQRKVKEKTTTTIMVTTTSTIAPTTSIIAHFIDIEETTLPTTSVVTTLPPKITGHVVRAEPKGTGFKPIIPIVFLVVIALGARRYL